MRKNENEREDRRIGQERHVQKKKKMFTAKKLGKYRGSACE